MPRYQIDAEILKKEDIINNITIGQVLTTTSDITYKNVNFKYPDGQVKPLCIVIKNIQLKGNGIMPYKQDTKYLKDGEFDAQRWKLQLDITSNKKLIEIFTTLDDILEKFGKNAENNAYDPDEKYTYYPICKKPTKDRAKEYLKHHKDETRKPDELLKSNVLKTYLKIKFKLPIDSNNKVVKLTKDTIIPNQNLNILKKDDDIDFDIDQPHTLDFLDKLTRFGNNIDVVIYIGSWYCSSKMFGYKAFIKEITLNLVSENNSDGVVNFDVNGCTLTKNTNKKPNTNSEENYNSNTESEHEENNNDDNEKNDEKEDEKPKEFNKVEEDTSPSDNDNEEVKPKKKSKDNKNKTKKTKKVIKNEEDEDDNVEDDD